MAKSIRTAIIAAAMTLLLALGAAATGLTAHAATSDQPTATEPKVYKTVKVADGITISDDAVFSVTQEANADGVTAPATVLLTTPKTVTISADTLNNNKNKSVSADLGLEALTTKPGEYTFKVTETAPENKADTAPYGWTKDNTVYYVHVYVTNAATNNHSYIVTEGTNTINKTNNTLDKKVDSIDFTNTFTKKAGDFTVTKEVAKDDYAAADTDYEFTATFTKSATSGEAADFVKNITVSGIKDTDYTINNDGTITFKLKKKGTVTFKNVPAGVKVDVVEDQATNVKSTTIAIRSNGGKTTNKDGLDSGEVLLGENANSIIYTNTYQDVTLTGVVTKIAPFVAMIAIAAGAAALYLVSRRRRDA
jgi:hypothetical protein